MNTETTLEQAGQPQADEDLLQTAPAYEARRIVKTLMRPDSEDPEHEDISDLTEAQRQHDDELHQLCEAWSWWCATRGYYGPPPLGASILGKLQKRSTSVKPGGGPDAICSARILAFHLAILSQGEESIDCKVFRLHYLYRVKNVKAAAGLLRISRQHWYRLLREFRRRAHRASLRILETNEAERHRMGVAGSIDTPAEGRT